MVFFRDSKSKISSLVIVEYKEDEDKNGLILPVHPPATGPFAKSCEKMVIPKNLTEWSTESGTGNSKIISLNSSHHQPRDRLQPYISLGRRILDGEAEWDTCFKIAGEFCYIPLYWEWLEDTLGRSANFFTTIRLYDALYASLFLYDRNANICRAFFESWSPDTNTLHILKGEISISLRDLRVIGGLSITGLFYDEVIPCATELTGVDIEQQHFLPRSCLYLFTAFFRIHTKKTKKNDKITINDWIKFWYSGSTKFFRDSKSKSSTPKLRCPSGIISKHSGSWSKKNIDMFSDLGVEDSLREETYNAALISCWLCVFVLPTGNVIRPATFKMASLMASGRIVSLVVPVLASIYKGLREISNSILLGKSKLHFPSHYLYAWLGRYFGTHEISIPASKPLMVRISGEKSAIPFNELGARELISLGKQLNWECTSKYNKAHILVDNSKLSSADFAFIVSLRSSFLTLRLGKNYVVEPYSPHRFSRQFGFYQDIPGELIKDRWSGDLAGLFQRHSTCLQCKTNSSVLIPAYTNAFHQRTTRRYDEWWIKVSDDYFTHGIRVLAGEAPNFNQVPKIPFKIKIVQNSSRDLTKNGDKRLSQPEAPTSNHDNAVQSAILIAPTNNTNEVAPSHSDSHSNNCQGPRKKTKLNASGDDIVDAFFAIGDEALNDYGAGLDTPLGSPFIFSAAGELNESQLELYQSLFHHDGERAQGPHIENFADNEEVSSIRKTASPILNMDERINNFQDDPQLSIFNAPQKISQIRYQTSLQLGECILDRLSRLSFNKVSSFKKEIDILFDEIDSLKTIDSSGLRKVVKDYTERVNVYLTSQSSLKEQLTLGERDKRLKEIELSLSAAKSTMDNDGRHIENLLQELSSLKKRENEIMQSICEGEAQKKVNSEKISDLEKQHSVLRDIPIVPDDEFAIMSRSGELLNNQRMELKNLKWWL